MQACWDLGVRGSEGEISDNLEDRMKEVVIAGAARTPMGGFQGMYDGVSAAELGGAAIRAAAPWRATCARARWMRG